ncbi:hypothetical protein HS088_TW03G00938 [Tripterygium wilfordii]|uniref:C2 NT-type domain-containing protein n=1 Tax=Tripterygium wilfordii TaxID=458696 RepID=A0A7J7DWD4_TRIWF|nr:uncharacterized protein LOC119995050 [Tripterygium wilfordii]KAF5750599.1 hypothetical protein HS088_TW03G00938 [Tripterygium wilfordii]
MVVKMMRWRPWPPLLSRKYEVRLVVRRLEGWDLAREGTGESRLTVEIRWKGPKLALGSLRRTIKRNFTKEADVMSENGVVEWDEEFQNLCTLTSYRDDVFHPWEISFSLFNGLNQRTKNKIPVVGTGSVNLAEFASAAEQKEFELSIPLVHPAATAESNPLLCISISLLELRAAQEAVEPLQRAIVPFSSDSSPPGTGETVSTDKDELSALKAGLRKVKIFTEYVSIRRTKKACREEEGSEGRCSESSEDAEYNYPFDTDSPDDYGEGELDEDKEDSSVRKSFSYGTLAYANCVGGSFYSSMRINGKDEALVYYGNHKSDVGCSHVEDSTSSVPESSLVQTSKRGLLSWRKRKLNFRSPKAKGEPLLKKAYGDEGGDDIDYDRRQLSSDEALALGWHKTDDESSANRSSVSDFGDDNFAVGCWEHKEVVSRDGHMKLQTQVFFASIDQRSERAAGESACTALVAVIADWFQNYRDLMPNKSQFDCLIREGSLEWRNLCENQIYRERFPDKHFDLETVLQAKIHPLSVVPGKSFIGFFHPEGMDEERFDFLHGAMSFDNIWDEISHAALGCSSNADPHVYIVSWNDHFFILKVEQDAYYIIDTLGERLHEGCDQAYILKFDYETKIQKLQNAAQGSGEKISGEQHIVATSEEARNQEAQQINSKEETSVSGMEVTKPEGSMKSEEEGEVVCRGKESCKEYIKNFLAAIPIRELQDDIKRGLVASTPLHHRLQIEFHYTQFLEPVAEAPQLTEAQPSEVAITADVA